MIDFSKPMRVKSGEKIRELSPLEHEAWHLAFVNGTLSVIHCEGRVWRTTDAGLRVENVPEPSRRYLPMYESGFSGSWHEYRRDSHQTTQEVVAWLIETDHGEGASPRWTYEREEVK